MSSVSRPALRDGRPFPVLIYGTAKRKDKPAPNIQTALGLGYYAIDTSSSRRFHNDEEDGRAVTTYLAVNQSTCRIESIFVQSKHTAYSNHESHLPYCIGDDVTTQVLQSILSSARNLQVDKLDAMFLERPLSSIHLTLEAWRALESVAERGGVRYLGLSNIGLGDLRVVFSNATTKPTFVQNRFRSLNAYDRDVVAFCKEHDVVYQAYGVFDEDNSGMLSLRPVQRLAEATLVSLHQALLQFILAAASFYGLQICFLDGATTPDHMKNNLGAVSATVDIDLKELKLFLDHLGWQ
jgi:diketogulonate reductase-like aldo/keto reductase